MSGEIKELSDRLLAAIPAFDRTRAEREAEFIRKKGISLYTTSDGTMPRQLYDCSPVPETLFTCGAGNLNATHSVAIVGTRKPTAAGIEFCRRFIADLAQAAPGTLIVSGLAYGIDVAAHRAALEAGLPTAAVLAHGLDTIYPPLHRDIAAHMVQNGSGLLVSEYPSETRIHRNSFLARNRIIAGLAQATIVVESADHGGSLHTARLAREYGRNVFAVPGRWSDGQSAGTNRLIASGKAALLTSAKEFLEAMEWECPTLNFMTDEPVTDPAASLEGDAKAIVDYLRMHPDCDRDSLTEALEISSAKLSSRLMELELDGLITAIPGNRLQLNF